MSRFLNILITAFALVAKGGCICHYLILQAQALLLLLPLLSSREVQTATHRLISSHLDGVELQLWVLLLWCASLWLAPLLGVHTLHEASILGFPHWLL